MNAVRFDEAGAEAGRVDLPATLFGAEPNLDVVHKAVVTYLANQRQGTAKTKTRSEVAGTNKKPFKQKKTGQARRGDMKTNVQRGGGVYGGPIPRDFRRKLPKKMRQLALRSALSIRAKEDAVSTIADISLESGKTRDVAALLKNVGLQDKRVLFVADKSPATLQRASRNIEKFWLTSVGSLSTYAVMWAERVVFTESALARLNEAGLNEGSLAGAGVNEAGGAQ